MPEHAGAHWAPDDKHGFEMPTNISDRGWQPYGLGTGPRAPPVRSGKDGFYNSV